MSKIEELLKEFCPDGVEYKTMEELFQEKIISSITPSFKVKRNDYKDTGECPIISQEEEYISGYCDRVDKNIRDNEYVCFGDHSEHIKYVNFRFVQGADGLKIITSNNKKLLNTKFLYYAISNFYKKRNNYERHFKYLTELQIPLPPLAVQREIVHILDGFTLYSQELAAELAARRAQYEFYRDSLLNFDTHNGSVIGYKLCPDGVEYATFGETCDYIRGVTYNKSQEVHDGSNDSWKVFRANNITLSSNTLNFNDVKLVSKAVKVKPEQMLKKGDILICAGSGSKEHVGKVAYIDEDMDYTFGGFMAVIRCDEGLDSRYFYHVLTGKSFAEYLGTALNSTTINNLSSGVMENFKFPLPPLAVQREIVNVLDNFDKICSDLNIGLPAEIEKRKKQYEYYRDKLLTFDTKSATILERQEQ